MVPLAFDDQFEKIGGCKPGLAGKIAIGKKVVLMLSVGVHIAQKTPIIQIIK